MNRNLAKSSKSKNQFTLFSCVRCSFDWISSFPLVWKLCLWVLLLLLLLFFDIHPHQINHLIDEKRDTHRTDFHIVSSMCTTCALYSIRFNHFPTIRNWKKKVFLCWRCAICMMMPSHVNDLYRRFSNELFLHISLWLELICPRHTETIFIRKSSKHRSERKTTQQNILQICCCFWWCFYMRFSIWFFTGSFKLNWNQIESILYIFRMIKITIKTWKSKLIDKRAWKRDDFHVF